MDWQLPSAEPTVSFPELSIRTERAPASPHPHSKKVATLRLLLCAPDFVEITPQRLPSSTRSQEANTRTFLMAYASPRTMTWLSWGQAFPDLPLRTSIVRLWDRNRKFSSSTIMTTLADMRNGTSFTTRERHSSVSAEPTPSRHPTPTVTQRRR